MPRLDRGPANTAVRILHAPAGEADPPLVRLLADIRKVAGDQLAATFRDAGARDVRIVSSEPDGTPFGGRLRALLDEVRVDHGHAVGLVVLGSGSVPLLQPTDARRFLETAAAAERVALANNAFSADVVAIARVAELPNLPDLPSDNALPRWLSERAGWHVSDLRGRARLGLDIDSPLDAAIVGQIPAGHDAAFAAVADRIARLAAVACDLRAELVVAGRTSANSLAMLERKTRCRVRAIVEERGLKASTALALGNPGVRARPPRSLLGMLLDRDGPAALGTTLAELGDGALVDTRVLLAHRLGSDEIAWPPPGDRFASDLLDPTVIGDPWLRALTASAADAPIPILLGGHSLVGPGLGLALGLGLAARRTRPQCSRHIIGSVS